MRGGSEQLLDTGFLNKLQKHLQNNVFYLPSFGPVYTHGKDTSQLIIDILGYWKNTSFLPYDKEKRWFKEKKTYIDAPKVLVENDNLYVPVLNTLGKTNLKIHVYSNQKIGEQHLKIVQKVVSRVKEKNEVAKVSIVTDKIPKLGTNYHVNNLYFKQITDTDQLGQQPKEIRLYNNLPEKIQKTFEDLANEEGLYGSQTLWYRFLCKKQRLSPIFVAIENKQIVGMIGPIDTLPDYWGKLQLLAPYFEVSNKARRRGIGGKLWQSAMNWALKNNAGYLLIQAEKSEAADLFYQNTGLELRYTLYSFVLL